MNKIDITKWKKFRVGDFFIATRGTTIKMQSLDNGSIPIIAAARYNCGIAGFYNIKPQYRNSITISCNGVGCGSTYYHDYEFAITGDAIVLQDKISIPNGAKVFIATVYDKYFNSKYSYTDKCSAAKVEAEMIALPTKSDKPDWEYMESYMKNIMQESERDIKNLQNISVLKMGIQTEKWGSFKCSKLFTARNTGNILARDVENGSGKTPYVTASGINNGVFAYIDASKYDIIKGHCILIGGKTFTVTYQADNFVSNDSHNFVIRTLEDNISDLSYKYLVTVIRSYLGQKYSWNDAVTKDKFLNENIPLPAKLNGQPDWEYMENYMKNIMNDTKAKLNILKTAI